MDDEKPELDHLKIIADLKAALELTPEDQHLKNALASAKQVPAGEVK